MAKVFVTRPIPGEGIRRLVDAFGENEVVVSSQDRIISRDEMLRGVKGVAALLPILTDPVNSEVMDAAGPQLKIIANYAVGYDNIDVVAATARGIAVTNTPGVLTETTADLAWALLMCAARRISESERFLRAGKWTGWGPRLMLGVDVHGKVLGIFGMGRIGKAVARRAAGFNMQVIYHNRHRLPEPEEKSLNATYVDKETLLRESDFVSIHVPLTPDTTHAIGAAEFDRMKDTSCLINTSRGPVIDEKALVRALKDGRIFAAGLDVFENEPNVVPELLDCENAAPVPHLGSASRETRGKMAAMAAGNIIARLSGDKPPNCVNPEVLG